MAAHLKILGQKEIFATLPFTHLGLVCSALNIERAEARGAEMRAETTSERAEEIEDARRR